MPVEIERKFLVISDAWRENVSSVTLYRQGYLSTDKQRGVRVRLAGDKAFITIKGEPSEDGVTRSEYEYAIPKKDVEEMLHTLCLPGIIEKDRHLVPHKGHTWEIDVFRGDNEGLIVAEIELKSRDENFEKPEWLGQEVTSDGRYSNAQLLLSPYKSW